MTEKEILYKWHEFIDWLNRDSGWVYRGVSDSKSHFLIPSVGRINNYSLKNEIQLFEHFKLQANLHAKNVKSDFEWLALAQHHGLPTRLLDWTRNPLVAAYFAVIERKESENSARIFAVQPNRYSFVDASKQESPFEIDKTLFFEPPISSSRIELQKGLFSIHPIPNKPALILPTGDLTIIDYAQRDHGHFNFGELGLPPFKNDYFEYQENMYLKEEYQELTFDIPQECLSYFEKRIRSLGIDELIFGDIDAVAKSLTYRVNNNQLTDIKASSMLYAKAILKRLLENNLDKCIADNLVTITNWNKNQLFFEEPRFYIEELEEINPFLLKLKGHFSFTSVPNYTEESGFFSGSNYKLHEKVPRITNKVFKYERSTSMLHSGCDFLASISFRDDFETSKIRKISIEMMPSQDSMFANSLTNYSKIIAMLADDDITTLKTCEVDSSEFLNLIQKLTDLRSSKRNLIK